MKKVFQLFNIIIKFVFVSLIYANEATKLIIHYYRYDSGAGGNHYAGFGLTASVETEYKFDHPFIEDPNPEMENWLILEVDLTIPEYQGMIEAGIIIKGPSWDSVKVNQAETSCGF